jgi:glycosyltransferase involved in cell wall biosynthesis
MHILMVSTSYPHNRADWRGIFIRHLVNAFARIDDLKLNLWAPPGETPDNVALATRASDSEWLDRLMQAGGISHLMRQGGLAGITAPFKLLRLLGAAYRHATGVDAYHINWLQCALPLPHNSVPALISVLGNDLKLLKLPLMRILLRRVMRQRRVVLCPNAEWMCAPLEAAFGDIAKVQFVPFGIDPGWYAIERRLDTNAVPKWLCVSRLTANKIGPLFDWTAPMFAYGHGELHLFGPMQEKLELPSWVHWHGPTTPEALRKTWFPQAHGLITLSRHAEGRPQVMLEALASGLPIVASCLPAHDDLLASGGGILCDDAESTLAAIEMLSDSAANLELGARGRKRMQESIGTWDDCAQRYVALYRQLLDRTQG